MSGTTRWIANALQGLPKSLVSQRWRRANSLGIYEQEYGAASVQQSVQPRGGPGLYYGSSVILVTG
jgi:hypothetical protein